jgi:endonuclease-3
LTKNNGRTFNIDDFIKIIERNYLKWNTPVVTLISNRGATPFEVLVSTILSLRTKDQVTAMASARLFEVARTPARRPREFKSIEKEELKKLIYTVGFYLT